MSRSADETGPNMCGLGTAKQEAPASRRVRGPRLPPGPPAIERPPATLIGPSWLTVILSFAIEILRKGVNKDVNK